MDKTQFELILETIISLGYSHEVEWARNVKPCTNANVFLMEYVWVVLNSGMKNQIARKIYDRITKAWGNGEETWTAFGHKGKVKAIDTVRNNYPEYFQNYLDAGDKIEFLKSLPFIGGITCFHLAKNLGHDCAKPDRHLVRIADHYKTTTEELCKKLSEETGERVATIDLVLWRAANLGIINTQKMNLTI